MKYCVGIDLGSTTTKAVVVDLDGLVLGRGITNSRSNYDVACQVALAEALNSTRFGRIAGELEREGAGSAERTQLLAALEQGFREQQYRAQLALLDAALRRAVSERGEAHQAAGPDAEKLAASDALGAAVQSILERMTREAGELFAPGSKRKSDFFRDLAGSRYLAIAEGLAKKKKLPFDALAGFYDKAILEVEAEPADPTAFGRHALAAARTLVASQGAHAESFRQAIERAVESPLEEAASVGTGYGRARLPFPRERIRSEILCHGLGAHAMFPGTRTVLDIGGQDTKAIQVDDKGIVTSFQMNDRCAAGCGRYLGYIADEMNLGLHELGPMACESKRAVRINSTCTVFAGAELRERLSLGEKREDILAGLHRAIVLRAMSLLARSGGVKSEFTFTGGVAKNPAAVDALKGLVKENYGEVALNISPDSIYTGALGAALFAQRLAHGEDQSGLDEAVLAKPKKAKAGSGA
ncbi:MAG: benzoyl-CoA reductase subunit A [Planctomycetes bacterium]|nr:benzoyl-CoA reductase subunit A [Planctomycetota bacterium]